MNQAEIDESFLDIRNAIKNAKITEAISKLEKFISEIDDTELEDQIHSYSARHKKLERDKKSGLNHDKYNDEFNKIVDSLMSLSRDAKQSAIEKSTIEVRSQLSELAKEGSSAIEELKRLNIIIAESRLLELQVMRMSFGSFFSPQQNEKFDQNIGALKEVLNKKDEDSGDEEYGPVNIFTQMQNTLEKTMPNPQPSEDDLRAILGKFKKIISDDHSNQKT